MLKAALGLTSSCVALRVDEWLTDCRWITFTTIIMNVPCSSQLRTKTLLIVLIFFSLLFATCIFKTYLHSSLSPPKCRYCRTSYCTWIVTGIRLTAPFACQQSHSAWQCVSAQPSTSKKQNVLLKTPPTTPILGFQVHCAGIQRYQFSKINW